MLIRAVLALSLVQPSSPFCIAFYPLLSIPVIREISIISCSTNTRRQCLSTTKASVNIQSNTRTFVSRRGFAAKMKDIEVEAVLMEGNTALGETFTSDSTTKNESETMSTEKVNMLDLISACIACTNTASVAIHTIQNEHAKNTRLKEDGSFVTDADYIAQGVIVDAIRSVSPNIQIMGEESAEEMMQHMNNHNETMKKILASNNQNIIQRTNHEVRLRYHKKVIDVCPLASSSSSSSTPVSVSSSQENQSPSSSSSPPSTTATSETTEEIDNLVDPEDCYIDVSRISIVVDPLDGTNSYASGETDVVSILIGIMLDHQPCVGVIGKPFGYTGLNPMLDSTCVTIYGGTFLNGVYIAGQADPITTLPLETLADDQSNIHDLPRAVISSSRSKGVVHDFCVHIGEHGLIQPEPLLISGAGEKSIRLILHRNKEALWFYPKGGTSRWDVAASDALLRCLGGKLTDKYGNDFNYNTTRTESENVDGVVACISTDLHAKCIKLFHEGDWMNQR